MIRCFWGRTGTSKYRDACASKNHTMWYKAQIIWFIILTNNGFQNMWTFPRVLWGWQPVYLPPAEMSTGKFITARRKVQWEWTFLRVVYFVNMLSASEHPQKCPLPKFRCTVVHHRLYTCTFCSIRTGFKSVRDRRQERQMPFLEGVR